MADVAKSCVSCGTDVTHAPRVRDPHGRYLCQPCVDALKAKRAAKPAAAPARSAMPPSDEPTPGATIEDASAVLDLAPTRATGFQPPPPKVLGEGEELSLAPPDATATKAGGRTVFGQVPRLAPVKCQNCGYDMKGLTVMKCPECGAKVKPPRTRDEHLEQQSREIARQTYLTPLIMAGVGVVGTIIAHAAWQASTAEWVVSFVAWLIMVPFGLLGFWVASLIFMEYDAPWHITAIRFLGIYAITMMIDAALPIPIASRLVILGALVLMFMQVMEMDKGEAILTAVCIGVMQFVVILAALAGVGFVLGML
jgi:hypothetical protein